MTHRSPSSAKQNGHVQNGEATRGKRKVLLVGARLSRDEILVNTLRGDYEVVTFSIAAEFLVGIGEMKADVVIIEQALRDRSGANVLHQVRLRQPDALRILVVDDAATKLTDEAIDEAAIDQVIVAPWRADQVGQLVHGALETRDRETLRKKKRAETLRGVEPVTDKGIDKVQTFDQLVFVSEAMRNVCQIARKGAFTDLPILIEGERGTGIELMARAIHRFSPRNLLPLHYLHCGTLGDTELQIALFGDRHGDPAQLSPLDELGAIVDADGSTLFLDEISEISAAAQFRLLAFLRDGEVQAQGSVIKQRSTARIVAASNKPLRELVAKGKFRQDLYFRLRGIAMTMPTLRERPEDIPPLLEHMLQKHSQSSRHVAGIRSDAMAKLVTYTYPGNVSELESEVHRLLSLTAEGEFITVRHLSPDISHATAQKPEGHDPLAALPGLSLKEKVESLEAQMVRVALERCDWNYTHAADELGLSRVGLANKIRRYRIRRPKKK